MEQAAPPGNSFALPAWGVRLALAAVLLPIAALLVPGAGWFRGRRDWLWAVAGLAAYGLIIVTPRIYLLDDRSLYDTYSILRLFISLEVYGSVMLAAFLARSLVANLHLPIPQGSRD